MKQQSRRSFIVSSTIGAIGATTGLTAMVGNTIIDVPTSKQSNSTLTDLKNHHFLE